MHFTKTLLLTSTLASAQALAIANQQRHHDSRSQSVKLNNLGSQLDRRASALAMPGIQETKEPRDVAGKAIIIGAVYGAAIRAARLARGWSQEDLAAKIGATRAAINAAEEGADASSDLIHRIAQVLPAIRDRLLGLAP